MNKPQWPTLQDRLNHPIKDELYSFTSTKNKCYHCQNKHNNYMINYPKESIQETRNNAGRTTEK